MKLHFRKIGEGQPFLILHGLFGSADNWQTLARAIGEKFAVYLIDQRNHGHSPHSDEMDYPSMAADLHALITDEKLENPILCGHSMGGKTAMYYTHLYPGIAEKLIVVDMGLKAYPPHHQRIFEALLSTDLDKMSSRREVEAHIRTYIEEPAVIQFLLKNLYWQDKEQLAWRMNIPVLYRETEAILEAVPADSIDIPALFIRGGKSNYILESDFPAIQKQYPRAEIVTLEEAGHWVHAEAPEAFLREVVDFASR